MSLWFLKWYLAVLFGSTVYKNVYRFAMNLCDVQLPKSHILPQLALLVIAFKWNIFYHNSRFFTAWTINFLNRKIFFFSCFFFLFLHSLRFFFLTYKICNQEKASFECLLSLVFQILASHFLSVCFLLLAFPLSRSLQWSCSSTTTLIDDVLFLNSFSKNLISSYEMGCAQSLHKCMS